MEQRSKHTVMNAIFTILSANAPNLLALLLLAIFIQSRLHKETTGLRKEISAVGERVARIEGRLPPRQPTAPHEDDA
ncbi:MAG: hypothetical protein F4234_08860 [Gammaproteobacteria bacterium]|nr:hypothetical protein [Gammaproteobacteria bacterium]MYF00265.1 hypothetical protein [Gammaproteobacteria bacterium]MYH45867.1 hypothetical protein [Gammaproteobacteria bacterium]MYL12116.1 hypothetical protein [Gammaproteobacteria bacterium]